MVLAAEWYLRGVDTLGVVSLLRTSCQQRVWGKGEINRLTLKVNLRFCDQGEIESVGRRARVRWSES